MAKTTTKFECPDCGMDLTGKNYNLDEGREKCSKTWHKSIPRKVVYVLQADVAEELETIRDVLLQHYPSEDEDERIEHTTEAIYEAAEKFGINVVREAAR